MRVTDMPSSDEVLKRQLRDPVFRAEWDRTAVARGSRSASSSTGWSTS